MIDNQFKGSGNHYSLDKQSYSRFGLLDEPYFYINGHNFRVGTNAESKSEINIVKNKMYVPGKSWGYTDMQWTNFSGETLTIEVYSRTWEEYKGDPVQPDNGGIPNFYNRKVTPHAVLKYWAQNFTTCHVETNLQAFEPGDYKIDEFSQSNPDSDFIVTKLTLVQYEKPNEIEQTYNQAVVNNAGDTSSLNALTEEVREMANHTQTCGCTSTTDASKCTAVPNIEVLAIQNHLQQWGYFPSYSYGVGNITPNGKFCYYTTQALKKFQEDRGIEVTGNFDEVTKSHFMKKLEGI